MDDPQQWNAEHGQVHSALPITARCDARSRPWEVDLGQRRYRSENFEEDWGPRNPRPPADPSLTSCQFSLFGSAAIMGSCEQPGAIMAQHAEATGRAIRLREVIQLTGASPPTIWRWSRSDPTFPRPFHLSPAITCWDEDEVRAWLQTKKAERGRTLRARPTRA